VYNCLVISTNIIVIIIIIIIIIIVEKERKCNSTSVTDAVETGRNYYNKNSVHVTGTSTGTGTFPFKKLYIDDPRTISTGVENKSKVSSSTDNKVDKDTWSVVVRRRTRNLTPTVSNTDTSAKLTILQTIQPPTN
jgi:hypothetical protein